MLLKNPTNTELNIALTELEKGNLIVYPTDTIYGIAANIERIDAIKRVYETKKRIKNKPLSICVHDINQIKHFAYLNDEVEYVINMLLPGPYTLLLKKRETVPSILTANSDKIGIRIPDNKITHYLTKKFPITTTSANISNKETPNNIATIKEQLNDDISLYIDIGIINNNLPSTIIDLTKKKPIIIREGQGNKNILNKILQNKLLY